jgi:hypothetical protein
LLLVRTHFQDRAEDDLAFQAVNNSRAQLCEVLATKLVSLFETRSELPVILTTRFNAFAGVKRQSFDAGQEPLESEIQEMLRDGQEDMSSALEIAIESGAKRFIRSPAIQQFVTSIWTGELLYRPSSQHSIMSDSYKSDTVEFFQSSSRPLLDHNVLRVPRIRRIIELGELLALVVLFFTVQQVRDIRRMELAEVLFILFTTGFALEEFAGLRERGWQTYFVHIWNIFDCTFLGEHLTLHANDSH